MHCILQLLLLSFLLNGAEGSDSQCDDSIVKHKKPTKIDATNKYGLWPGLVNDEDLVNGEQLFGTEEAMELIWKNQNPPDCSKAKYLVSTGWYQGFGSEVHYHGVVLGLALDTGRVLIQEGGWTWRYRNEHCKTQGLKNMECYMLPLSKCTIHDAMATMLPEHKNFHRNSHHHESHDAARDEPNDHHPENKTHLINNPVTEWTAEEDKLLMDGVFNHGKKGHWSVIAMSLPQKTDVQCHDRWKSHTEPSIRKRRSNPSYIEKILNEDDPTIVDYFTHHKVVAVNRVKEAVVNEGKPIDLVIKHKDTIDDYVIMVHEDLILKYHNYTPRVMAPIWKCAGLNEGNEYMWWRAISASYMLRPNKETLALIERHRDAEVKKANGHCVSAYIRHGDKGVEMQLVPFTKYASAALTIFNNGSNADVAPLAGGDGKKVMFVATEDPAVIGQAQSWGNSNKIDVRVTELNRKILSDKRNAVKPHDLERSLPAHREYEYVSYLVHLADNVKCAANICTIPSNFCRLIDELRGTVGGKANKLMVDLSSETCPNSPCFRYTGFANHPGAVYDPKTRIWR